jgi:hypothetical protein
MMGLLQRVVGQAIGARSAAAQRDGARIRPATTVHAQVPAAHPREELESTLGRQPLAAAPAASVSSSQAVDSSPAARKGTVPAHSSTDRQHWRTPQAITEPTTRVKTYSITREVPPTSVNFEQTPRTATANTPEPLLDEMRTVDVLPAITPSNALPVHQIVQPAQDHAKPTEVHVHIGRIEVIAATEPAAPRKQHSTPRNSLPLSEYLARRKRP